MTVIPFAAIEFIRPRTAACVREIIKIRIFSIFFGNVVVADFACRGIGLAVTASADYVPAGIVAICIFLYTFVNLSLGCKMLAVFSSLIFACRIVVLAVSAAFVVYALFAHFYCRVCAISLQLFAFCIFGSCIRSSFIFIAKPCVFYTSVYCKILRLEILAVQLDFAVFVVCAAAQFLVVAAVKNILLEIVFDRCMAFQSISKFAA